MVGGGGVAGGEGDIIAPLLGSLSMIVEVEETQRTRRCTSMLPKNHTEKSDHGSNRK